MAVKIYNVNNHGLSGEQLRKLFNYSTDEYAGILGSTSATNIFSKSSSYVTITSDLLDSNNDFWVIGAGYLISVNSTDIKINTSTTSNRNCVYCVEIILDDFANDVVNADVSNSVSIAKTTITSDVTQNLINEYTNLNRAIVIDNVAKIPLFSISSSGGVTSIITARDKSTSLNFLTQDALQQLLNEMLITFTHQAGSTDSYVRGGKVGDFNVRDSKIRHYVSSNMNPWVEATETNGVILHQSGLTNGFLTVKEHVVSNYGSTIKIDNGGTGATTSAAAKKNLGIYYGKDDPNTKSPVTVPNKGDLYFKILT